MKKIVLTSVSLLSALASAPTMVHADTTPAANNITVRVTTNQTSKTDTRNVTAYSSLKALWSDILKDLATYRKDLATSSQDGSHSKARSHLDETEKPLTASNFLKQVGTIQLPGKGGHGDVVAYDPAEKAMYVAQSPDNNVIVVSTVSRKIIAVIPNMDSCNGIAFGPKYIYVANGGSNQVAVIQKGTWKVVATVNSGGKTPDAVYYDGNNNEVFVGNDSTNNMGVINAMAPFNLETTFGLQPNPATSGPDLGVFIPSKNRLYQSDDNQIDVINTKNNQIMNQISTDLPSTQATKAMIYDPSSNLVWVGTTDQKVYALNPATNTIVTTVTAHAGQDQIAWDPTSKMLFLGQGSSGTMEVINMTTKQSIGYIPTEAGFHTLNVDTAHHIVYAYLNQSNKIVLYKENMGLLK